MLFVFFYCLILLVYIFFFLFFCIISRYLNVEHFLKYYDDFIFSWMFFYGLLTKKYKKRRSAPTRISY